MRGDNFDTNFERLTFDLQLQLFVQRILFFALKIFKIIDYRRWSRIKYFDFITVLGTIHLKSNCGWTVKLHL